MGEIRETSRSHLIPGCISEGDVNRECILTFQRCYKPPNLIFIFSMPDIYRFSRKNYFLNFGTNPVQIHIHPTRFDHVTLTLSNRPCVFHLTKHIL